MLFRETSTFQNNTVLFCFSKDNETYVCERMQIHCVHPCILIYIQNASICKETCGEMKMLTSKYANRSMGEFHGLACTFLKCYNVSMESLDLKKKRPLKRNRIILGLLLFLPPQLLASMRNLGGGEGLGAGEEDCLQPLSFPYHVSGHLASDLSIRPPPCPRKLTTLAG